MRDLKLPDGRERLVRHGHGPERMLQTGIGPVEVSRVKIRDRGATGEEGEKHEGIGSPEVMAVSFSSKRASGTALVVEDDDNPGAYKSIWAFKNETRLGVEIFTPKK